jgi:hypothetical protein
VLRKFISQSVTCVVQMQPNLTIDVDCSWRFHFIN